METKEEKMSIKSLLSHYMASLILKPGSGLNTRELYSGTQEWPNKTRHGKLIKLYQSVLHFHEQIKS